MNQMRVGYPHQERLEPSIIPLNSFDFSTRMLIANLQDHDSTHLWNERARVSTCIDHSKNNTENDSITFNFQTGHIRLQFRIVFDDNFETVDLLWKGEEHVIQKSLATHKCGHRLNDKKETTYGTKTQTEKEFKSVISLKVPKDSNLNENDEASSAKNVLSTILERTKNNNNNEDENAISTEDNDNAIRNRSYRLL